jgi:hypothetical protein
MRLPSAVEIEAFCEAIDHLALVTVVVCDNNASIQRYRDLLFGLQSKGRRVILVCTSYRQVDLPANPPKSLIEASEVLSPKEKSDIQILIERYGDGGGLIRKVEGDNILFNLYYRLPATRSRLTAGIGKEAKIAEDLLRHRTRLDRQRAKGDSQFAERLLAAGFSSSEGLSGQDAENPFEGLDDDASRLISLVMVPGQVDCPVPIDILMRAMQTQSGKLDLERIGALFGGLDLFRWRKGEQAEDLLVGPRLALEAQLICRRRLMNSIAEGEFVTQLIGACRLNWDAGGSERRFILDLLQRVGPDGPLGERYGDSYLSFARSLTYFPLDVSLWIPQDLLAAPNLTSDQRMELKADILSTLERIDPSAYPPSFTVGFPSLAFIRSLGPLVLLFADM